MEWSGGSRGSNEEIPLLPTGKAGLREGGASSSSIAKHWYLVLVASLVCSSTFLLGYDSAVLNGPTSINPKTNATAISFNNSNANANSVSNNNNTSMSTRDIELATSMALLGAMCGALSANIPVERIGLRWVLLGNNFVYVLGSSLCALATNYATLLVGRYFVGLGFGIASAVVPQLLSEISPKQIRGAIASMNQLAVTIGLLVTNLVWFGFHNTDNGWRYTIWYY